MKGKIVSLAFLLCLTAPTASFALDTTNKVAFLQDVMKDMVKQTLYGIGTNVLNKYVNPAIYNYTTPVTTTTTPVVIPVTTTPVTTSVTTTTTSDTTTNQQNNNGYVPGQDSPPEDMIPVS